MPFNIVLKKNLSEKNKIDKVFAGNGVSLQGDLRDDTSIIDPVIIVQWDIVAASKYNYLEIGSFNRKYFITNIKTINRALIEISAHVDVLSSFATDIRKNKAIIKRQENKWNMYLNDGSFRTYQNPMILTKEFPNGFNTMEFVLAVAGK